MKAMFRFFFVLALSIFNICPVFSAELSEEFKKKLDAEFQWLNAEKIVFTSSRVREDMNKAAASVSVITEDMIRNMGARNILDVLMTVPGLGITQSSLWVNQVESRGISTWFSEKILFMTDGHSLDNNLLNGGSTLVFDKMSVDKIKRIEVIRGPASALYGANAFMGLVNIITKDPDDVNGLEATARLGSFSMQQYNLQFGKSFNDLKIFANANFFDNDGFKAYVQQDADYGNPGDKAPGYNHEWGRNHDIDLKLEYKNLKLRVEEFKREDGPYFGGANALNDQDHSLYKDNFVELGYTYKTSHNLDLSAKIYRDYLSFENLWNLHSAGYESKGVVYPDGQIYINGLTNTKVGGELLATFKFKDVNTFIVGGMFEKHSQSDVIDSFNGVDNTGVKWAPDVSRELWAIFAEDLYDIKDNLRLTLGLRYDNYSDLGGVVNPRVGIGWEFIKNYNLKMMYGQAFRAPTFAEIYNQNLLVGGNKDLIPEKIKTYEVSLGGFFNDYLSGSITGFYNDIDNLIENIAGQTQNSGRVETEGVELEIKAYIKKGSYIQANYTYVRTKNKNDGSALPDIPSYTGYIAANAELSRQFNFNMGLYIKGDMLRYTGDPRGELSGYAISNATIIAKHLAPKIDGLELRGSVYNIFDKQYLDPSPLGRNIPGDYPMPGRSFVIEAKYKF
ncbi:MAG: hypothetical protein BWK80_53965 [Desulfobacteraceae bacterium IS3]|nr:MAG: hypothetical protein BWK80_53965 [Desulfobacteraceae bacterium IS3]